jgi:hypothetical protein
MAAIPNAARAKTIVKYLGAFSMFLFVTLIPWLLALHAALVSRKLADAGWSFLSTGFKIVAITLAAFTAVCTIWCFFVWLFLLLRAARGLEE